MGRDEYLLARGWRRAESNVGERWTDPIPHPNGYALGVFYTAERAEQIQLDRDAACRDYVNARRPAS